MKKLKWGIRERRLFTNPVMPNLRRLSFVMVLSLLTLTQCKKDIPTNNQPDISVVNSSAASTSSVSSYTLSVSITTNRTLSSGQTFTHQLTVRNGTTPVGNYTINIDDPVRSLCTFVKTNSNGVASYNSTIPSSAPFKFHQYRFFLPGGMSILSTVAVKPTSNGRTLPNVSLNLNNASQSSVSSAQMCFAARAQNIGQTASSSTSFINSTFGKDFRDEILSNPISAGVITIGVLSCAATVVFPPAGGVCAATAIPAISNLSVSTLKVMAKRSISRSSLSSSEKNECYNAIDFTALTFGIATLKIDDGLKLMSVTETAALGWDYNNVKHQLVRNSNGTIKGVSLTGVITSGVNAGEMCVISFLKR